MSHSAVTSEQVLYFRARRSHLLGPGAADVAAAARDLLGAQSQQIAPSLHALSLRTAGRPTADAIKSRMFDAPRSLVRTWGPRETVYLYDPADWSAVVSARPHWSRMGRKGPLPDERLLEQALAAVRDLPEPPTRATLSALAPSAYVHAITPIAESARQDPQTFAAGRLLWCLALRGDLLCGELQGSTQTYPLRERWFPGLRWPSTEPQAANVALLRRYLSVFGPATEHDVAHYFGAKITTARKWMAALEPELTTVQCEDVLLRLLTADLSALREPIGPWPTRLLPTFDTMLMAHKDKRWTVPNEADRPLIWKRGAQVAATVVHRGRLVATWSHKAGKRAVTVQVVPLTGWSSALLPDVQRDADELAAHLGVPKATVKT